MKKYGITISEENTKTHIPSFNLLAGAMGASYAGAIPSSCKAIKACGTCPGTCPGCYAMKMTRYPAVYTAYADNTRISTGGAEGLKIMKNAISEYVRDYEPRRFRIHDSGDFFNLLYMITWDEIAREFPDTKFYCYTKRVDLLRDFIDLFGRAPAFTVQLSTWPGILEEETLRELQLDAFPRFEYDDGTRPELASLPHCPAVDKNGKRTGITCNKCKHCANAKPGEKWAVYAH